MNEQAKSALIVTLFITNICTCILAMYQEKAREDLAAYIKTEMRVQQEVQRAREEQKADDVKRLRAMSPSCQVYTLE